MNLRLFRFIAAFVVVLAGAFVAGSAVPTTADACHGERLLPIVYVHGGAGSAAQYETQAMRWSSNGYPNLVTGIDRTSSSSPTLNPMLDEFFDAVMAETGADQIYVVAHSLGVQLMNNYLDSSPERSARVAKYIGIDSASAGAVDVCPGNPQPVPCLGLYREENAALHLGSNNIYFPDHGHTQMVTSAQSFVEQYKFLTGREPWTTLVLPQLPGRVEVSGRVIYFPANTGVDGATLQIWEVDGNSGARKGSSPKEVIDIGPTGEWGPVRVNGLKSYEFTLLRPDVDFITHYYFQPFTRSDNLVRLLSSPAGSPILTNTPQGPDHSSMVIIRYKEWWSDQGDASDTMWVTTQSPAWDDDPVNPTPPTLNILSSPGVGPRIGHKIGIHAHDAGADKVSTLNPVPFFVGQVFQTGVDIWMPATEPPDGKITLMSEPRGDTMSPQTINIPNWASEGHRISVQFRDYVNCWPWLPWCR